MLSKPPTHPWIRRPWRLARLIASTLLLACTAGSPPEEKLEQPMSEERPGLAEVIARHRQSVMKLPGIVGIAGGLCTESPDEKCILVYSTTGEWPPDLPRELDGYRVELSKATGGFRPLSGS